MIQHSEKLIVQKALKIIMDARGLKEDNAFKMLRKMSMDTQRRIDTMAEWVVIYPRRFGK